MIQSTETFNSFEGYSRLIQQTTVYWKVFLISVIGMVAVAGTEVTFAALMKPLMDEGFIETGSKMSSWIPLLLIATFLVRAVAMFVSLYGMSWVGRNIILELRNKMFTTLLQLPKSYYDTSTTGEIISKFTFDIEHRSNDHYGIPDRKFVTNISKAKTVIETDLQRVRDPQAKGHYKMRYQNGGDRLCQQ